MNSDVRGIIAVSIETGAVTLNVIVRMDLTSKTAVSTLISDY